MFDGGEGQQVRAASRPYMADLTVQRIIQLERPPILPDHLSLTLIILQPVDAIWREAKGGELVVSRQFCCLFQFEGH